MSLFGSVKKVRITYDCHYLFGFQVMIFGPCSFSGKNRLRQRGRPPAPVQQNGLSRPQKTICKNRTNMVTRYNPLLSIKILRNNRYRDPIPANFRQSWKTVLESLATFTTAATLKPRGPLRSNPEYRNSFEEGIPWVARRILPIHGFIGL